MFVRGIPPTVKRGRKLSNPVVCGMGDENLCSSFCPRLTMLSQTSQIFSFFSAEGLIFMELSPVHEIKYVCVYC